MVTDERITAYINSLESGSTLFLDELEKQAKKDSVPIIKKETQSLLKFLLAVKKPHQLLEVGAAVGFSSLFLEQYSPPDAKITTIENYPPRIHAAKENIRKAGKEGKIRLLEGDALQILPELAGRFEFVFVDAAKAQYVYYLPDLLRLLAPEGILVSDNVLQNGEIIQSHFAVPRRNRTIYKRMRDYLYTLTHHKQLETVILPVGDGVAVSYKKTVGDAAVAAGCQKPAGPEAQAAEESGSAAAACQKPAGPEAQAAEESGSAAAGCQDVGTQGKGWARE